MRYLKTFEGSIFENEIQQLCNNSLTYLIDEGFVVSAKIYINYIKITLERELTKGIQFSWERIKDDFIPFLNFLDKKYTITEIEPNWVSSDYLSLSRGEGIQIAGYNDNGELSKRYPSKKDILSDVYDDLDRDISQVYVILKYENKGSSK